MPKYFNKDDDAETLEAKCILLGMHICNSGAGEWCVLEDTDAAFYFCVNGRYHEYHFSKDKMQTMKSALLAFENGVERYRGPNHG